MLGRIPVITLILLVGLTACTVKPQIRAVISNDRVSGGSIQLERSGTLTSIGKGTEIQPGDILTTNANEQAVLVLENGAVEVVMFENTQIQISSIDPTYGELVVKILKRLKGKFEVRSKYGTAQAEGTIFYVAVERGVDFRVVGLEGAVLVAATQGRNTRITKREEISINSRSGAAPAVTERTVGRTEYNELLDRVNAIERISRPGAARLMVPEILGLPLSEAQRILRQAGFRLFEPIPVLAQGDIGTVVRLTPGPGSLLEQSNKLVLNYIEKPTNVPDLTGKSESTAIRLIENSGLKIGSIRRRITGNAKVGIVIYQSQDAGSRVAIGTPVDIDVEAESRAVPDVGGLTEDDAVRIIRNAGFEVGSRDYTYLEGVTGGRVAYQSPAGGQLLNPGASIDLTIELRGVEVPPVYGMTARNARRRLTNLGFYVPFFPDRNNWIVVDHEPQGYDIVPPGNTVTLELEEPKLPVVE